MEHFKKVVLTVLVALFTLYANAYDCEIDGIYYNLNVIDHVASVTYKSYDSYSWKYISPYQGEVNIPSTIIYQNTPYEVTEIGEGAFGDCIGLTSVIIPESVTTIGKYAFTCTGLKSINIPKHVAVIGLGAFQQCNELVSVDIPTDMTTIEASLFSGCPKLVSVTLPQGVTDMGNAVFSGCKSLTSITIPRNVKNMGMTVFEGCTSLTDLYCETDEVPNIGIWHFFENVDLKNATLHVRTDLINKYKDEDLWKDFGNIVPIKIYYVFDKNTYTAEVTDIDMAIADIQIPETVEHEGETYTVTKIHDRAFAECTDLKTMIIPKTVTSIGDEAFVGCSKLQYITLLNNVVEEGKDVFKKLGSIPLLVEITDPAHWCTHPIHFNGGDGWAQPIHLTENGVNMTEFVIPDGVTTIVEFAFAACNDLTALYIPKSVTSFGNEGITAYCNAMTDIYYYSEEVPKITKETWSATEKTNKTLHVPASSIDAYKADDVWGRFINIVALPQVTYLVDGKIYKSFTPMIGEEITPEAAPVKKGYTFSGWSWIPAKMPAEDVIITGSLTVNKYTLTYKVDGETYKTVKVKYGAKITPEAAPVKEGYTFSGWSEIPAKMPAKNVTVTGCVVLADSIEEVMADNDTYQIFTSDGKHIETLQPGINIIRMSDGQTKKVYVK